MSKHFLYVADPMCSWCWGFSPVIGKVAEAFGEAVPVRVMVGGLRPGTVHPMHTAAAQAGDTGLLSLWAGQGVGLACRQTAAELMARLADEIEAVIKNFSA